MLQRSHDYTARGEINMDDKYLLEHGYKQYKTTPLDNDYIIAKFQKRFDDDFGKKYFIDVSKWSHYYIPADRRDKWWKPYSYEYDLYVTMFGEKEKPIYLKFGTSWTLEEVENFADDFFNKMKLNYYESWDGRRAVRPE